MTHTEYTERGKKTLRRLGCVNSTRQSEFIIKFAQWADKNGLLGNVADNYPALVAGLDRVDAALDQDPDATTSALSLALWGGTEGFMKAHKE